MALLYCTQNNGEYQYQNQTNNKDVMMIQTSVLTMLLSGFYKSAQALKLEQKST